MVMVLTITAPAFTGCNATKYLKENEYLYKRSDLHFTDSTDYGYDTTALKNELLDLSKLDPNEKTLGIFPLKTSLYMLGDTGIEHYIKIQEVYDTKFLFFFDYARLLKKIPPLANDSSGFRRWLMKDAGEPPQLTDSFRIMETQNRINNYLYNRGFFEGNATYTTHLDPIKKTGTVEYTVTMNTLYRMRNIYYEINEDPGLLNKINLIEAKSALAPGKPIDVDLLKSERVRLNTNLRNVGYYKFQKEYIYFEVDTASGTDSLDIYVRISNPANDTVHHPFAIKNIYVYPNASVDYQAGTMPVDAFRFIDSTKIAAVPVSSALSAYKRTDTTAAGKEMQKKFADGIISDKELLKWYVEKDSSADKPYIINKNGQLQSVKQKKLRSDYYLINSLDNYNPKAIANNIFINPGNYYSDSLIQKTVASFSSLGIYKYVAIQAEEMWDSTSYLQFINLYLRLDPLPAKGISYELNANTTSDYLLGNSLNLTYTQKNLFHNLDQFKLTLKGGIETQLGGAQAFINTSEFNAGLGITLPRLWPMPVDVPKRYFPKTELNLNFNYINQVNDFTLFNTSFEYVISILENSKRDRAQKQHIFKMPIPTVNIVRVPVISDAFEASLEENPLLQQSFDEVVITGYSYTLLLNTQPTGPHFFDQYLRTTTEVNAPFSDFIKLDADYRTYMHFSKSSHLVARAAGGWAVPLHTNAESFLNSNVIPYVKQFFTGGAYSVRAFSVRKLGPGGFVDYDTTTYLRLDQVADMKLELNLEYRFDIISLLEGALFCDIGNTFTFREDAFRPHSQFHFNDFYKLLAVGPGAGLRLDFSYFVIRIDAAYPLYDPALDGPYRQEYIDYYDSIGFKIPSKTVAINLAIGYPF